MTASFQKSDVNLTESRKMEQLIPASKIATLSQGHFVGKVADTIGEEMALKLFNGYIPVETGELQKTQLQLPRREVTDKQVQENFTQIKLDIKLLLQWEKEAGIM